jgi:hypothetical protein
MRQFTASHHLDGLLVDNPKDARLHATMQALLLSRLSGMLHSLCNVPDNRIVWQIAQII